MFFRHLLRPYVSSPRFSSQRHQGERRSHSSSEQRDTPATCALRFRSCLEPFKDGVWLMVQPPGSRVSTPRLCSPTARLCSCDRRTPQEHSLCRGVKACGDFSSGTVRACLPVCKSPDSAEMEPIVRGYEPQPTRDQPTKNPPKLRENCPSKRGQSRHPTGESGRQRRAAVQAWTGTMIARRNLNDPWRRPP